MSVDTLRDKIRKTKNPIIVDFSLGKAMLPSHLLEKHTTPANAYGCFCREIMGRLKGMVPGVRFSFAAFSAMGTDGLRVLSETLQAAGDMGFYTFLDAPLILSPAMAEEMAEAVFENDAIYPCDGVIISAYPGSECIKPFLPYCNQNKKSLFCVVRTSNKSGAELQDLVTGSRLVHAAAADLVNRFGAENVGKSGYSQVGVLAGASSAQSLKNLRTKYPRLFLLVDDLDYSCCNAKNCAEAFDRFGFGAAVCAGTSVTCAWRSAQAAETEFAEQAAAAADRIKRNMNRYITIL